MAAKSAVALLTLLCFASLSFAQNAYRPYRPISNIFGSLFRGPQPGGLPQKQLVQSDTLEEKKDPLGESPTGPANNLPPPPPPPQNRPHPPHPGAGGPRRPPPPPHRPPRPVSLRGSPPRILLRPQGPLGPLIGPLPKRPGPHKETTNGPPIPSLGQVNL